MASPFQATALVASPSYPDAIAWSDENLIAVASGHLVTILNPALPLGPRGVITIPTCDPFPIGVVDRQNLLSGCLLPVCLSRDRRPCVRSISWSPLGMAPNSGCLLAVCTTEGRVKLYRPPFCDFGAEWIEVIDISDRLYDFLASTNFGESCSEYSDVSEQRCPQDLSNFNSRKERKRRKSCSNQGSEIVCSELPCSSKSKDPNAGLASGGQGSTTVPEINSNQQECKNLRHLDVASKPDSKSKGKSLAKMTEKCTLPQITANQYASRSAMLWSLAVAWLPLPQSSSKLCSVPQAASSFSLLALGSKSGNISLWKIYGPECYSIEHSRIPTIATMVGLLQAHNSWITSISLALYTSDSSSTQVLLVSGCSDGSVDIWQGNSKELLNSSEVNCTPLFLLKKVSVAGNSPISVISLSLPAKSPHKMLLAVGKGSGCFEVWTSDISNNKFDMVGSYDAHDHIVTGLAWAFDGACLYSCSRDNFLRSWILHGNSLCEVPIPSNTLHLRSSTDLPNLFTSCIGLAVSPGNLMVAMVRNLDLELLDPMYQARAQKAIVEFYWIGGQRLQLLSSTSAPFDVKEFPGFPKKELTSWESNILWSLKKYEHMDKPPVVWDIIVALLAFKKTASKFVDHIMLIWLTNSCMRSNVDLSAEKVLLHVSRNLSRISSRQLHLLNIFCRRVMLSELKADQISRKLQEMGGLCGAVREQLMTWMELLFNSERELRKRLVGFSFSASRNIISHSTTIASQPGHWYPDGLAQMEQWAALNHEHVADELKVLISEVRQQERSESVAEEKCSYCLAPVPFESPEVGFCRGAKCNSDIGQGHGLPRCAVSMKVCPPTSLWFCICCHRWASRLAPEPLFSASEYHLDFKPSSNSFVVEVPTKPLCPFCGILLQRLQPDFLLSASPV